MALITLTGTAADSYRQFLADYRKKTGLEPGPEQRTEAYLCAHSKDPWNRPSWVA